MYACIGSVQSIWCAYRVSMFTATYTSPLEARKALSWAWEAFGGDPDGGSSSALARALHLPAACEPTADEATSSNDGFSAGW
jgi:hypothetical protein